LHGTIDGEKTLVVAAGELVTVHFLELFPSVKIAPIDQNERDVWREEARQAGGIVTIPGLDPGRHQGRHGRGTLLTGACHASRDPPKQGANSNENYARELMELHTLGVDAGYTRRDVQELARVLTGFGVDRRDPATTAPPKFKPELAGQYIRKGLYEFNPNRHDYGDKQVLGVTIRGSGPAELDQVIDLLSRNPATAHHISRKLAMFFVSDDPPESLVDRMATRFARTDGDIAAVLRTMFESPEFTGSLRTRYKDPVHYVVSAVRVAYDEKPILNAGPMINWLNRLGEAPYNRQTPDGNPLTESSWTGPGQLTTRFEIAKAIASGAAGLFKTEGPTPTERPAFPQLSNALYFEAIQNRLAATTRQALDQAASPQEWNMLLLSAPEFMLR
jgi:uncharacterized protein (DUF1800 family)